MAAISTVDVNPIDRRPEMLFRFRNEGRQRMVVAGRKFSQRVAHIDDLIQSRTKQVVGVAVLGGLWPHVAPLDRMNNRRAYVLKPGSISKITPSPAEVLVNMNTSTNKF